MEAKLLFSIFLGVLWAVGFSYLNIYLVFITNMAISASLLVPFLTFFFFRKVATSEQKFYLGVSNAISGSASLCSFAFSISIACLYIFSPESLNKIDLLELTLYILMANAAGFLVSLLICDGFDDPKAYPFPKAQVSVKLVGILTEGKVGVEKITLMCSFFITTVISVIIELILKTSYSIISIIIGTPSYIGFSLSPVIFGVGLLNSTKQLIYVLPGALISLLIWYCFGNDTTSFGEHIAHPLTLSLALPLVIVPAVVPLFRSLAFKKAILDGTATARNITSLISTRDIMLFGGAFMICASGIVFLVPSEIWFRSYNSDIIAFLSIFTLVSLALLSFSVKVRAQTGMSLYTSVIYILAPIFIFLTEDVALILLVTGLYTVVASTTGNIVEQRRIAHDLGLTGRPFWYCSALGLFAGIVSAAVFLDYFIEQNNIGSAELPSVGAYAWNTFVSSILESDPLVFFNGYALAFSTFFAVAGYLSKRPISLIGLGILLPVSVSLPLFAGAWFSDYIKSKSTKNSILDSAIAAGILASQTIFVISKDIF